MADSDPTDAVQADQPVVGGGATSLMRLPNELLFAVGSLLGPNDMARLMRTSRLFYELLVNTLYQRDADNKTSDNETDSVTDDKTEKDCSCCSSALRWGCLTSNVDTLKRALAVPNIDTTLSWPHTFAMALDTSCPSPVTTLTCLLDHGLPLNVPVFRDHWYSKPRNYYGPLSSPETFWPLMADILHAASLAPRWCPVPVVQCCLERGRATLAVGDTATTTGTGALRHVISSVWDHVLGLVQVRGPRLWKWKWPHFNTGGRLEMRHDHCLHDGVACNVAMTRLLLIKGKADPDVVFPVRHVERYRLSAPNDSLLVRAVSDPRRPVELLQCLADAGADLQRLCQQSGSKDGQDGSPPLLHAILRDAVLLQSLASYPRRRHWDCYPAALQYSKAEAILRFLLGRGVPFNKSSTLNQNHGSRGGGSGNDRTLWLLDRWDPRWKRFCKRPGRAQRQRPVKRRRTV